jgi:hypothetical protein
MTGVGQGPVAYYQLQFTKLGKMGFVDDLHCFI